MKEYIEFEKNMLSNPETFFPMFEAGNKGRSEIIWKEYLEWQKLGGKTQDIEFRYIGEDIFRWNLGKEYFAQKIDKTAPFTKEQYQKGLSAVYSFMNDKPQYYKFRKLEGMFNPLKLLLYRFISPHLLKVGLPTKEE